MLHDLVLSVSDLLDVPGASRVVDLRLPVPAGFDFPLVTVLEPVALEGVVESVVEGLLVRGGLEAEADLVCARCLAPLRERVATRVTELYRDPAEVDAADELEPGYAIADMTIDLDALVRDGLATALPDRPLCRPDCRGLCPQCGTDWNAATCDCTDTTEDSRWSKLRDLHLPN